MHTEFIRGVKPSKSLGIGNEAYVKAFKKIMELKVINIMSNNLVRKIKIRKNKFVCHLIIMYAYGQGMIEKFPAPLDDIFDVSKFQIENHESAEYSYDFDIKYYDRFNDILSNIENNE